MCSKINRVFVACFILSSNAVVLAAPHKVQVSDPATAKTLAAQGARLIADYGSFQLLEADDAALAAVSADQTALADEMNVIELNARRLDTRVPEVQALRRNAGTFAGKRLRLVHFAGPIKPEWVAALEQSGARVITYIPQNAYLVYGDAPALARMQSWARTADYVSWDGDYSGDYKIHPRARLTDANGLAQNPGTDTFAVQLVDDPAANPATLALINQLRLAPIRNQYRVLQYLNVIVRLPADRLNEIAAQPEVVSIQPYYTPRKLDERQDQIVAGNLSGGAPTGPGYLAWLTSKGFAQAQFDASGFVVDVSDSGIDNGTTAPGHFGLYELGNPSLPSRVVYNRLEGSPNPGTTKAGCDGHGNLNAQIISGFSDLAAVFPHADSAGYHYGLGICPFVKVGSSVIFDPDLFTSPDYENLQSEAYHDGARISANSWGTPVSGAYDVDAQRYDALVRDSQPASSTFSVASNQSMVIVFAAGNDGPGITTLSSPGTAKNVITVGASENFRSVSTANGGNNPSGNDGCNEPDSGADNANDMIGFSSRGPCTDSRMKPDLVAPGSHITGGVGQNGLPTTNGTGLALSCFNASGVCGLPGGGTPGNANNFFPLGQQFYTVSSGTSHSTPAVAGACALVRQYFINNSLTPPSPAMTKAFLMNSARYLTGSGANDTLWSSAQGMGELNLGTAFDGVSRAIFDQLSADKFTATGQTRTFSGRISDPTKPFRVTLAWTDAPGPTSGNAFKNDLNLVVTLTGGITYKGNVFNGALSTSGGVADNKNNVESVFLPAGLTGTFTVTVSAANINSDGVPNEAPSLDQDFALVIYNAVSQPVPLLTLTSTVLTAENCGPTNGAIDPGEAVTVAFALKNIGTADSTNLVVTLLQTNGVVFPGGPISYGALVAGDGAVTQAFTFTAVGFCGGTITPMLQLQDDGLDLGSLNTNFVLGALTMITKSFTNAANIKIPAAGTQGKASPYPATNMVSGITGLVSKVTVTLTGFTHTFPDDVDVLLVGPAGQNVMLMSDAGGGISVTGLTLTFDDSSPGALPDGTTLPSGTYHPTNFDTATDSFPSPAPTGPFGQRLSVFNGQDPNGVWMLYVNDDANGDVGNITQGWQLSITTSNTACCAGSLAASDLAIGESVSPPSTNVNGGITFNLTVTNFGPNTASSVTVTDTVPAGLSFVSANLSQGTFTNSGNAVTVNLGTLASGATAFIALQTTATSNGTRTNTAGVSSGLLDPAGANNTAIATVTIVAPPPVIQSITHSNDVVTITWSAIDGQLYKVQYKDNLLDPIWNDLLPDVTASGSTASKSDSISASTQRFYRVVVP